jgi:hypothetical protein
MPLATFGAQSEHGVEEKYFSRAGVNKSDATRALVAPMVAL